MYLTIKGGLSVQRIQSSEHTASIPPSLFSSLNEKALVGPLDNLRLMIVPRDQII